MGEEPLRRTRTSARVSLMPERNRRAAANRRLAREENSGGGTATRGASTSGVSTIGLSHGLVNTLAFANPTASSALATDTSSLSPNTAAARLLEDPATAAAAAAAALIYPYVDMSVYEDYLRPIYKDGDVLLEVECGDNRGMLYLSRLCQGSKGPCILFNNMWLTPNEFQYISGRETAKDWKRSIRHHGKSMKLLLSKGILAVHPPICDCDGCRISSPVSASKAKCTGSKYVAASNLVPGSLVAPTVLPTENRGRLADKRTAAPQSERRGSNGRKKAVLGLPASGYSDHVHELQVLLAETQRQAEQLQRNMDTIKKTNDTNKSPEPEKKRESRLTSIIDQLLSNKAKGLNNKETKPPEIVRHDDLDNTSDDNSLEDRREVSSSSSSRDSVSSSISTESGQSEISSGSSSEPTVNGGSSLGDNHLDNASEPEGGSAAVASSMPEPEASPLGLAVTSAGPALTTITSSSTSVCSSSAAALISTIACSSAPIRRDGGASILAALNSGSPNRVGRKKARSSRDLKKETLAPHASIPGCVEAPPSTRNGLATSTTAAIITTNTAVYPTTSIGVNTTATTSSSSSSSSNAASFSPGGASGRSSACAETLPLSQLRTFAAAAAAETKSQLAHVQHLQKPLQQHSLQHQNLPQIHAHSGQLQQPSAVYTSPSITSHNNTGGILNANAAVATAATAGLVVGLSGMPSDALLVDPAKIKTERLTPDHLDSTSSPSASPSPRSPASLSGLRLAAFPQTPPPGMEHFTTPLLGCGTPPVLKQMEQMVTRNYSDIMRSLAAKYNNSNPDRFNGFDRKFDGRFPTPPLLGLTKDNEGIRKTENHSAPPILGDQRSSSTSSAGSGSATPALPTLPLMDMSSTQALLNMVRSASAQSASQLETYLRGAIKRPGEATEAARSDPLDLTVNSKRPRSELVGGFDASMAAAAAAASLSLRLPGGGVGGTATTLKPIRDFRELLGTLKKDVSEIGELNTGATPGASPKPNSPLTGGLPLTADSPLAQPARTKSAGSSISTSSSTSSSVSTGSSLMLNTSDRLQPCLSLCSERGCGDSAHGAEVAQWNVEDVCKFVASIDTCAEYVQTFREQSIDGTALPMLTEEHMINNMNMKLGPVLKFRASLAKKIGHCAICMHCIHCHGNIPERRPEST